jgi:hypothetical protein
MGRTRADRSRIGPGVSGSSEMLAAGFVGLLVYRRRVRRRIRRVE